MKFAVLVSALFAIGVSAIDISKVDPCIQKCATEAATKAGCKDPLDQQCVCVANVDAFTKAATDCIVAACPDKASQALDLKSQLCSAPASSEAAPTTTEAAPTTAEAAPTTTEAAPASEAAPTSEAAPATSEAAADTPAPAENSPAESTPAAESPAENAGQAAPTESPAAGPNKCKRSVKFRA